MFDHEKLDAYRLAIAFSAWVSPILDQVHPRGRRPHVLSHLDESATSVALNIAEGNGKRSLPDRIRYLEIARGSALECAACLDVLVARSRLAPDVASQGKATLVRVVSTITKLIERHLHDAARLGRDGPFGPPPEQIRTCGFPASGSHLRSTGERALRADVGA